MKDWSGAVVLLGVKWKIHNLKKDKVMKMKNMFRSIKNEALEKYAEGSCFRAEAQREIDRRERRRARRAEKEAAKAAGRPRRGGAFCRDGQNVSPTSV